VFGIALFSMGVVVMASATAQAQPPHILEVAREYLKPDAAPAVHRIEVDAAQICIRLKFPHRYLVLESLTGPKEFWYLNGFASQADLDEVAGEYAGHEALIAALAENLKRKAPYLATKSTDVLLRYRPELSEGTPWLMGYGRFLITAWAKGAAGMAGTVFEAPDGNRLVIRAARTLAEARSIAAADVGAHVFAIRPELGWPDDEWVRVDPQFWSVRQR
jgi:hypothetical protein